MTPINKIKDRCRIDEFTGCWIWTGALSTSNGGETRQPRIYATDYTRDPSGKTKTVQTGNRAVWHAFTGKPIPEGHLVFKAACCADGLCVNPAHLQCGTYEQWGQSITEKEIWKGQQSRIQANRAIGRARSVVTPDLVREIQSSPESGRELSQRSGLSDSVISRVRRGQLVSVVAMNNPFMGLLA